MKITYKQGFYDPDQPENRTKEKEKGKEARAREKRLPAVFCLYCEI